MAQRTERLLEPPDRSHKVIEPKLLAKLRDDLLKPDTLALIAAEVKAAMGDAADGQPEQQAELQKQLADERRKRKN
jgi:hypothetical protein